MSYLEEEEQKNWWTTYAWAWQNQGDAFLGTGDFSEAETAYQQVLSTLPAWEAEPRSVGSHTVRAFAGLARVALARGEPKQALAHVEELLEMARRELPGSAASREKGVGISPILEDPWIFAHLHLT